MFTNSLYKSVVVIVGAANLIGFQLAQQFKNQNLTVVLFDFNGAALAKMLRKLTTQKSQAHFHAVLGNVKSGSSLQDLLNQASKFGEISLVINNVVVPETTFAKDVSNNIDAIRDEWESNLIRLVAVQNIFKQPLLKQKRRSGLVNVCFANHQNAEFDNYSYIQSSVMNVAESFNAEMKDYEINKISAHNLLLDFSSFNLRQVTDFELKNNEVDQPLFGVILEKIVASMHSKQVNINCEDLGFADLSVMSWVA